MLPSRPNFPFSCPTPFVSVCAYTQPGLEPIGASYADGQHWDETTYHLPIQTTNITATLYYQTSSKEYIDFLREYGGLDGAVLGEMWDDSKSAPEMVAVAAAASPTTVPSTPTATPTASQYGLYLPLIVR